MLLVMTACFHVWFAEFPTTWIPGLAVGLILYVLWAYWRQVMQRRKDDRERERQRQGHWGYS